MTEKWGKIEGKLDFKLVGSSSYSGSTVHVYNNLNDERSSGQSCIPAPPPPHKKLIELQSLNMTVHLIILPSFLCHL